MTAVYKQVITLIQKSVVVVKRVLELECSEVDNMVSNPLTEAPSMRSGRTASDVMGQASSQLSSAPFHMLIVPAEALEIQQVLIISGSKYLLPPTTKHDLFFAKQHLRQHSPGRARVVVVASSHASTLLYPTADDGFFPSLRSQAVPNLRPLGSWSMWNPDSWHQRRSISARGKNVGVS